MEQLFSAYQKPAESLRRWVWFVVGAVALVLGGISLLARHEYKVVTPHGIRTVSVGMAASDLARTLGRPVATERIDGHECSLHGTPNLKDEFFTLYALCYDQGRLVKVVERKYRADMISAEDLTRIGQ